MLSLKRSPSINDCTDESQAFISQTIAQKRDEVVTEEIALKELDLILQKLDCDSDKSRISTDPHTVFLHSCVYDSKIAEL